jgi:hypothetical protein
MQVIQHPWSRKLNNDIIATVTVNPGNGIDPSRPHNTVQQALPCWNWLFTAAQRTIEEAQRAYAQGSPQQLNAAGTAPFIDHGWSLPYTFDDVSSVCIPSVVHINLCDLRMLLNLVLVSREG